MSKNSKRIVPSLFTQVMMPGVVFRATESMINEIMIKDAPRVSTNVHKYCLSNVTLYDLAINSWMGVIADSLVDRATLYISTITTYVIEDMRRDGLFAIIEFTTQLAEKLISCLDQPALIGDILAEGSLKTYPIWADYLNSFDVSDKANLVYLIEVLRYLKRFSPCGTDALASEAERKFRYVDKGLLFAMKNVFPDYFWTNNSLRPLQTRKHRSVFCEEILALAVDEVDKIMVSYKPGRNYFSSGAIVDGTTPRAAKYAAALRCEPDILEHPLLDQALYTGSIDQYTYCAQFLTVEKSWDKRRPIAKEEAGRAWHMQGMRLGLRSAINSTTPCDLDDQTLNQRLARKGSTDRSLATIDLSAASDHIAHVLVLELFKNQHEFLRSYVNLRSHSVVIGNKELHLEKALTSGSPLCFEVETIVFWSLTVAAMRYFHKFFDISNQKLTSDLRYHVSVYGDDIICPTWAAKSVIETLEYFGFEINADKTHYLENDPYRESCGKEYIGGSDVTSIYFPRKTLEFVPDRKLAARLNAREIVSMCELQHRLIACRSMTAATFVAKCVRAIVPDMTESRIGSCFSDLWAIHPQVTLASSRELRQRDGGVLDLQRDVPVHYSIVSEYRTGQGLVPFAESFSYNEWLRRDTHVSAEEVSPSPLFDYLEAGHHVGALTSKPKNKLVKIPDYNE